MLYGEEYADWHTDDHLELDSLDSGHETVVSALNEGDWLAVINRFIDLHIAPPENEDIEGEWVDYNREMGYIDD